MFDNENSLDQVVEQLTIINKENHLEVNNLKSKMMIVNAQKFGGIAGLSLIHRNEEIVNNVRAFLSGFDTLIVDEAHHFTARTWKQIVDAFLNEEPGIEKKLIFLTATPFRGNGGPILTDEEYPHGQNYHIAGQVNPNELTGIIRPVRFDDAGNEINLYRDICAILQAHERNYHFVPQAMIIVQQTPRADEIVQKLNHLGGENFAVAIYGNSALIENLKNDFTNGVYRVAVVCKKLVEGYDNPNVTTCVILRAMRSRILFAQFIGRCMRIKNNANEIGQIKSYSDYDQRVNFNSMNLLTEDDIVDIDEDIQE